MPGRKYTAGIGYRYGFNGKENDNEVKGIEGSQQDYGMRVYDTRIGRFLSVDPITNEYPFYTPYQFSGNNPIKFIDIDGKEPGLDELIKMYKGNLTQIAGVKAVLKNILEPYITSLKVKISESKGQAKSEFESKLAISQTGYGNLMVYVYKLQRENENIEVGLAACYEMAKLFGTGIEAMEKGVQWIPFLKRKTELATGPGKNTVKEVQKKIDELKGENIVTKDKGVNNTNTKKAVDLGNKVHYDSQNGGTGEGLPTELQNRYPETQFRFSRRGQKGADVEYIRGTHPSEYSGSTWAPGNNYADFKPGTNSGSSKFNSEVKNGKLPSNTQKLTYDPITGKLQ